MKKFILIDGNSIFHRAFYAIPPLTDSEGNPTNAVYGFLSMLFNLIEVQKPDYLGIAFDRKEKTFRHEEYKDYKATRTKGPDELYAQMPLVKELLQLLNIAAFEKAGYEADDLLGTLSSQADKIGGLHTLIVTGDRDALQLITETTHVVMPVKGLSTTEVFGPNEVERKYGLSPAQIPDLKGLQGDSSDNIKGVKGIGAKTALDLLQRFGSIEDLYKNIGALHGAVRKKLEDGYEDAFFSKRLATIKIDVPEKLDLDSCGLGGHKVADIKEKFFNLGFKSLIPKFEKFDKNYSQQALF